MTDDELIAGFESAVLPAEAFTHEAHVRTAWWYLRQAPLAEALARFSTALRRFATAKGSPGRYHETITVAYMLIIGERLDAGREMTWNEFVSANSDLLSRRPSVLSRYYEEDTLATERARRVFVMPDRGAAPTAPER